MGVTGLCVDLFAKFITTFFILKVVQLVVPLLGRQSWKPYKLAATAPSLAYTLTFLTGVHESAPRNKMISSSLPGYS